MAVAVLSPARRTRASATAPRFPPLRRHALLSHIAAARAPRLPATGNDPALTRRIRGAITNWLGADAVPPIDPEMGGDDFSQLGRTVEKVPICLFRLGAADPASLAASRRTGVPLPSLHSSKFAAVPEPTIRRRPRSPRAPLSAPAIRIL